MSIAFLLMKCRGATPKISSERNIANSKWYIARRVVLRNATTLYVWKYPG